MRKNTLNTRGFKQNKFFAVIAVFTLIALLLMIESIAKVVVDTGNSLGVNMPPVPIFRQTAANMFLVGAGAILLVMSVIVVIPIIKVAVVLAGLALAGYGIYQLYKTVKGEPIQDILPKK